MFAARLKRNVIVAITLACLAVSLFFQYLARAAIRQRDEQVQRLRERMAQLENDVARRSTSHPAGLSRDELEAYLALGYEDFDATPGSGFRRFRDQPRDLVQAAELIEAYLARHGDLPPNQWTNLQGHAAQLFALGGVYERAITHLDLLRAHDPRNNWADATKAFLLFDREALLAARRRAGDGPDAAGVDLLVNRFGQSYTDAALWESLSTTISVPQGASSEHRAAAEKLAKAFALPVTVCDSPAEGGIPAGCLWLEVRPMGGTPDVEGYIILHAIKRTVITATNEQRLDAAVKRFIELSRRRNGQWEAPFGLTTSFELARSSR